MLNKNGGVLPGGRGTPLRPLGAPRHVTAEPAAHVRELDHPVSR
ncbi:hypothetical protein ACFWJ5_28745 [Streptomyces qaidamensis]